LNAAALYMKGIDYEYNSVNLDKHENVSATALFVVSMIFLVSIVRAVVQSSESDVRYPCFGH
jgi:hypothetical protein